MSHEKWERLRLMVTIRDMEVVKKTMIERGIARPEEITFGGTFAYGQFAPHFPCPAWVMDPAVWGTCSGGWNLDHVKVGPRMGVKAEDDEEHLIALCATHDERGLKAGYCWNTSHREEERAYLRERRRERELLEPGGGE